MTDQKLPVPTRRFVLTAGAVAGTAALLPAAARAEATPTEGLSPCATPDEDLVMQIIEDWPEAARQAATSTVERYGPPQEATPTMLIWRGNAPWLRTVAHRDEVEHAFPAPHVDVLEQVIEYHVPLNFFEPLAAFTGSIVANRTMGTLSVRGGSEAENFLALNLAEDIVRGRISVEEARDAYAEAFRAIEAGEEPDAAHGLHFGPPQGDMADPDVPVIDPDDDAAAR